MGMTEKIKILLVKKGETVASLARIMNQSTGNLYGKLDRDNFSEKDLHEIADALGVKYEGFFTLENGDIV